MPPTDITVFSVALLLITSQIGIYKLQEINFQIGLLYSPISGYKINTVARMATSELRATMLKPIDICYFKCMYATYRSVTRSIWPWSSKIESSGLGPK